MPESGLQGCKIDFTTDPAKIGECHFIVVAAVYDSILEAGVHRASSIKVAEAAKVIENTQRAVNIALMNELSIIFHKLGVDPYYLTYKAEELGYHPEVILSGRRINDGMGKYVADAAEVHHEYGLEMLPSLEKLPAVDAVVVAGFCRKGGRRRLSSISRGCSTPRRRPSRASGIGDCKTTLRRWILRLRAE